MSLLFFASALCVAGVILAPVVHRLAGGRDRS